jgi:ABC-2 type transport system ATP-binding protein
MKKARQRILLYVGVSENTEKAAALLESHDLVSNIEIQKNVMLVTLKNDVKDYTFIPSLLINEGFQLNLFREEEINLETAFMELTKGLVQ